MAVSDVKNVGLGKLIADRMRGVKYGCVQVGDGKAKLVRSDALINLNDHIGDKFGMDCCKSINADEYAGIMKMTKKFAGEVPQTNNFPLKYFNALKFAKAEISDILLPCNDNVCILLDIYASGVISLI